MKQALVCLVLGLAGGCAKNPPATVSFEGRVGEVAFACGSSFYGVGSTATEWTPQDFRMYVSHVELIDAAGVSVPLELDADTPWQVDDVALLDFEDASGGCSNGTAQTNAVLTGTAPEGVYTGIRFDIGVSDHLNHQDASVAPSPLNLSTLFWGWEAGYKFMRIDGATTGQPEGTLFHLGSTGCSADASGEVYTCNAPNRPQVELTGFDPFRQPILVDLAGLFYGADLDENADQTPTGCMSIPTDADCEAPFSNLGLAFGNAAVPATQNVFRFE